MDHKLSDAIQVSFDAHSNGANGLHLSLDRLADFIHSAGPYRHSGLDLPQLDVQGLASSFVRSSAEAENLINNPWRSIFSWKKYDHEKFDDHILASESPANGLWYSTLSYFDGLEFIRNRDWGTINLRDVPNPTIDDVISVETLDASCFKKHTSRWRWKYRGANHWAPKHVQKFLHWDTHKKKFIVKFIKKLRHRHRNPEACLDSMHVLLNHITTPVFAAAQLHDPEIRDSSLFGGPNLTSSFALRGHEADAGSVCSSHDENFECTEEGPDCPAELICNVNETKRAEFSNHDFAERVRFTDEGFTGKATGRRPEESPQRAYAPVGHGAFITQIAHHLGWSSAEKMGNTICDDNGANNCFWESPKMEQALQAWLERDATIICVENYQDGQDPNRPLTSWSETTPGSGFDDRCGRVNP